MSRKLDPEAIPNFLASARDSAPEDSQHVFLTLEDLWERKLWHQLTDALIDFFAQSDSASHRYSIFNNFILTFADKINQLRFVTLGLSASAECNSKDIALFREVIVLTNSTDDKEQAKFLTSLAEKVDKPSSQDAHVYATTELASVLLKLDETSKAREKLEVAEKSLEQFDSVETIVHASFYRVNADYYSVKSDYSAYYKNALLYLACIDESDLPQQERVDRAYSLAIAALVSDTIYNFGELLLHPILNAIRPPHEYSWVRELLFAFNRGDLDLFDRLSNRFDENDMLKARRGFLYQKISLAALTELVFRRPPHDRIMLFKTISQETKVKLDEIEHLIMKALSLGLVRGRIDQVDGIAKINWVQPKVLERGQIEGMKVRLKEWDNNVNELGHWIEGVGKDVWAA